MSALALGVPADARAAINGFEGGDGNQTSLCTTTVDWECLPASEVLAAEDASGAADDGFAGGSKETQPDSWKFETGPIQAKADLLGAWTSVGSGADGRTFLNIAFVRAGATGDTYLGIELNQVPNTWVNSAGTTIACRTDGDVLLSYEASNPSSISLFRWDGSSGPAACPDGRTGTWQPAVALAHAFEARMNDVATANHLDVARLGATLGAETFGEGSIDLGALADSFSDPADTDGACSYYRHMSVKTRSSAEIGSSLQDWARGSNVFARACETPEDDLTAPVAPAMSAPGLACALPLGITGTSEPGSTVTVYAGAIPVAFAVADAGGAWSASLGELAEGAHTLTAEATDAAGNTSVRSAAVGVVVDTIAPAAPTLAAQWAGTGMVDVSGTAEPGSEVSILDGTTLVATVTAAPDGSFATTLVGVANADHSYTAVAGDACHSSAPSAPVTVSGTDVVAPGAPTLSAPASSCTLPLLVSGTAEAGSTVAVFDGTTPVGTTVADGDGAWELSLATLADGAHSFTAEATDTAGNTSVRSVAVAVAVDATAPAAPSLAAARVGDDVQLSGVAEPGSQVVVHEGDVVVASLTAGTDGAFAVTLEGVSVGAHTYRATAADGCRVSDGTDATVVIPPPPPAPTLTGPASSCDVPVVVSGTAAPGATVTIDEAGEDLGSAVAAVDGTWELSLDELSDGVHTLSARTGDGKGGTLRSDELQVSVDTTPPSAPEVQVRRIDADTVEVSGQAEKGRAVTVREGEQVVAETTAAEDGGFAVEIAAADDMPHSYVAEVADACRVSGRSQAALVPARTVPDPPLPPAEPDPAPAAPTPAPAPTATPAPAPTATPVAPAPAAPAEELRAIAMGGAGTQVRECMNKAFRAYLPVKNVRSARYYVDGKLAAVVRKPDALGQFYAVINPAKYTPGAHTLTARVSFRTPGKKATTLKLRFRRCDECQSRRSFRIRVPNLRDGERAVSARVYVNGRATKVVKGKRLRARVVLVGLPRGTYKVKIVTRTNRGRIHRSTRTYRTCVPKKVKGA